MIKTFTKTFEEVKKLTEINIAKETRPNSLFLAGIKYLAEILTNPKRQDNVNIF